MKINKQDIDHLNAKLHVTIEKDDYLPKWNKELASYRQKVELKGFRKGKTPAGVIKRMYGKSLLMESVNELLQKGIVDFLEKADFKIIGQPLDSGENEEINWDINAQQDFSFSFDIGLQPDFQLNEMGEGITYERTIPVISDEIIAEELETTRKQAGIQVAVDDLILENDMLEIKGKELDGDQVKEGGVESTFSVLLNSLTDAYKEKLLTLKSGDTFRFDISKLEKDRDTKYVRNYLMQVKDETLEVNDTWEGEIIAVRRLQPAEMNKEFFEKAFGPEANIEDETQAKEKIRSILEDYYTGQADSLMFEKVAKRLKEVNQIELPEEFLSRWLKEMNTDMSESDFEENFPEYLKSLRWDLVKSKFAKSHALEVGEEELRNEIVQRFTRTYGQYNLPQEMMIEQLTKIMKDKQMVESIATQILEDKIFGKLKELYTIVDIEVDLDAFKEMVKPAENHVHDHDHDHEHDHDHDHDDDHE